MACGDAYLLYDDEDADAKPHLHIVITEPDASDRVVLVSITTLRAKSDIMTRLQPGDHDFIVHASAVTYAYSKVLTTAKLSEMVTNGDAKPKSKASGHLLARLQSGMLETDRAPYDAQNLFREFHAISKAR